MVSMQSSFSRTSPNIAHEINALAQDYINSVVLVMELLQSYIKLSILYKCLLR